MSFHREELAKRHIGRQKVRLEKTQEELTKRHNKKNIRLEKPREELANSSQI